MGGMSNAHPAHFFVRAFLAADHSCGGAASGSVRTKVLSKDSWLFIALLSQRRDELRRAIEGAHARLCAPCIVAARSRFFLRGEPPGSMCEKTLPAFVEV